MRDTFRHRLGLGMLFMKIPTSVVLLVHRDFLLVKVPSFHAMVAWGDLCGR